MNRQTFLTGLLAISLAGCGVSNKDVREQWTPLCPDTTICAIWELSFEVPENLIMCVASPYNPKDPPGRLIAVNPKNKRQVAVALDDSCWPTGFRYERQDAEPKR
jgi:hypothetical protein